MLMYYDLLWKSWLPNYKHTLILVTLQYTIWEVNLLIWLCNFCYYIKYKLTSVHNQSYIVDARGSSLLFSLGFFNNDECWHEPFYFHVVTTSFPSVYLSRSSLLLPSYNSTMGPYPLSSHIMTKNNRYCCRCWRKVGKTVISMRHATTAAITFYSAKSR